MPTVIVGNKHEAKSRKYREVLNVKSQEKTRQCRENWSHQLERKQVPKRVGAEPGVRKGKCSLLAFHTRCKCSMKTTRNSVKVKLGIGSYKRRHSMT